MRKILALLLCLLMVLSFAACSSNDEVSKSTAETKIMTIEEAIDSVEGLGTMRYKSGPIGHPYFETIEKDYAVLDFFTYDGWNDEFITKLDELNKNLGFSGALVEKFADTSVNDGKQTEENENYKITWSYDKLDKLKVIYEMK